MRKQHPAYPGYEIDDSGRVFRLWKNKELKRSPRNAKSPSLCVWLDGKIHPVATLVYETFVGPVVPGTYIAYRNGNRQDPSLANLTLVTAETANDLLPRVDRETWKTIPHWTEYEASSEGRIRDNSGGILPRYCAGSRKNYRQVFLCQDGARVKQYIHRLVAAAFHPTSKGSEVDHIDGDGANNRAENLEWVSHAENARRAHARGRLGAGRSIALSRELVRDILTRSKAGQSSYAIAKELQMSVSTVLNVVGLKTATSRLVARELNGTDAV
jgi:hypothetical protein